VVPLSLFALGFFGLYRSLVRYVTGKILLIVGKAALVSASILFLAGTFLEANLPRSVPIVYAVFLFLSVGGLRFFVRQLFRQPRQITKIPVIIYGAGDAGLQLLNSLFHGREYAAIALVDDDTSLQGMAVGGLKVFAPSEIPRLVDDTGAQVILLAIPSMSRARRREIVSGLEDMQLEIKTIPGMSEIISGKAKISELRTVSAEDLLGRDPVAPNPDLLRQNISGKIVMVSGAGGSIGSELCRQILTQAP
jgi:FlaA1/EpsC-like NDP-sugar epimerase